MNRQVVFAARLFLSCVRDCNRMAETTGSGTPRQRGSKARPALVPGTPRGCDRLLSLVVEFTSRKWRAQSSPRASHQSFKLVKHKNFKLGALKTLDKGFASLHAAIRQRRDLGGMFQRRVRQGSDTLPTKPGGTAEMLVFADFGCFHGRNAPLPACTMTRVFGRFADAACAANTLTADRRFEPVLVPARE